MTEFDRIDRDYDLPPRRFFGCRNQTEFYGALELAARHSGLTKPILRDGIEWKHGWHPEWVQLSPELITLHGSHPANSGLRFLVGRADEAEYLTACGVTNVRAIGLPIVYLPPTKVERRPNTLLVLPIHSIYYTKLQSAFDDYADFIADIAPTFDDVLVCIHPVCIDNGFWIKSFRRRGIRCVTGAMVNDMDSLARLQTLMSRFEFATTNGYGSHLVYAASLGAKVSIAGPMAEPRVSDYSHDWFFANRPTELRKLIALYSQSSLREKLPQFFVEPRNAIDQTEWGQRQIGADCKLGPADLIREFHWNRSHRWFVDTPKSLKTKLSKTLRTTVKAAIRYFVPRPPIRQEEHRLQNRKYGDVFTTDLLGRPFQDNDPGGFIAAYPLAVIDRSWKFASESPNPRAIIVGAGTGLTAIGLLKDFPQIRLTLIEPDSDRFRLLSVNIVTWQPSNLPLLVNRAIAPQAGTATFLPGAFNRVGSLSENDCHPLATTVECDVLSTYLQEPVDFLAIIAPYFEMEILTEAKEQLKNVSNLVVRLTVKLGESHRLDRTLELLRSVGFEVHIRSGPAVPRPFQYRMGEKVWIESVFELFCYRLIRDE